MPARIQQDIGRWGVFRALLGKRRSELLGLTATALLGASVLVTTPSLASVVIDEGGARSGIWLAIASLSWALLSSYRDYRASCVAADIEDELRCLTMGRLLAQTVSFFEGTTTGDALSRVTCDAAVVRDSFYHAVRTGLSSFFQALAALIMLVLVNSQLLALSAGLLVLLVLMAAPIAPRLRARVHAAQESLAQASSAAAEALTGIRTVKAFGQEGYEHKRYRERSSEAAAKTKDQALTATLMQCFIVIGLLLTLALIWSVGSSLVVEGSLTLGALSSFFLYALIAAGSAASLTACWTDSLKGFAALERLLALQIPVDHVQAKAVPALRRRTPVLLELENVTFKYPSRPEATALHEISFAIGEGQSVGITGASGSGKSTIFTLILRFHDPSSGRIYFRGHATTSVPTAALRAWVEYVPQDAYLFTGTLADNIRYGSPHASGRQAKNAARVACVDEFAESLPRGYETPVGANGVQLSAGQKQRIALARAVLKGGSLLLLDEATSALDATTESAVLRNLSALAGPRTILSIAHRLSSFSYSSKILVVGDGRLFAERSPSEMVESTERGMRESQLRRAI